MSTRFYCTDYRYQRHSTVPSTRMLVRVHEGLFWTRGNKAQQHEARCFKCHTLAYNRYAVASGKGQEVYCRRCLADSTFMKCDLCTVLQPRGYNRKLLIVSNSGTRKAVCAICIRNGGGVVTCSECEGKYLGSRGMEVDGTPHCPNCLADKGYALCQDCNEWTTESESIRGHGKVCLSCFEQNYSQCYNCERYVNNDNTRDFGYHNYCERCHEDLVGYCEECESECFRSDMSGGLCDSCYDDRNSDRDIINDYGFKPTPIFYGKDGRHYGLELEVNSEYQRDHAETILSAMNLTDDHVYAKEDGSIDGFELVTHPHTPSEHAKLWKTFAKAKPKAVTSYEGGACGIHIHASRKELDRDGSDILIRKVIAFVNDDFNRDYIETIAQRKSGRWSQIKHKTIETAYDDNDERYHAINLRNRNTIEFRIFRGNVRYERIMKCVEFVDAAISYCDESIMPGQLKYKSFVRWVAVNKAQYPNLHNFHVEKGLIQVITELERNPAPTMFEVADVDPVMTQTSAHLRAVEA